MSKIQITANGGLAAHGDKIILDGHDISDHVKGYTYRSYVGSARVVELELVSSEHLIEFFSSGKVIPYMELGGKKYRLVEEEE